MSTYIFIYHTIFFRDVAEFLQPCQSKCQHTSCSACRFVTTPSCRKCKQDDFRCMKRFGKCVRKDTCSRRKFPCKEKYSKVSDHLFCKILLDEFTVTKLIGATTFLTYQRAYRICRFRAPLAGLTRSVRTSVTKSLMTTNVGPL